MTNEITHALLSALKTREGTRQGEVLALCRRLAIETHTPLYLVGGAVRDLLLARESLDIDLVIESDTAAFGERLAAATGGAQMSHDAFGTATVRIGDLRVDLARARREEYPHPGSLPVVEPATLSEDLARRDFTINAVALRLTPEPAEIIDPFRGVADTRSGLIRVLHDRSFQDDATRMLRAVRYAARLGFKLATQTEALTRRDATYLNTVGGTRLRHEFELLFGEPTGPDAIAHAHDLGLLEAIHPALTMPRALAQRWHDAQIDRPAPVDELGFCLLADPRDEGTARSVSKWLNLEGPIEHALQGLVRLRSQSPKLARMSARASEITEFLDGYPASTVWAMSLLQAEPATDAYARYLREWRHTRPSLGGNDLIALGATPGPRLGDALRQLRAARLDGEVATREEELELARRLI